jgi:CTP synthase
VVGLLTEWLRGNELEKRLAAATSAAPCASVAYHAKLAAQEGEVAEVYCDTEIVGAPPPPLRGHMAYREPLETRACAFCGVSPDGLLPRSVNSRTIPGS